MKRLIILFLLAYATSSFAQVPFEVSKSCFVVNGRNITEPCLLSLQITRHLTLKD